MIQYGAVNLLTTILLTMASMVAAASPPLRTTAEIRALSDKEFAQRKSFDLSGTVVFSIRGRKVLLTDQTGSIFIIRKDDDTATVQIGDRIHTQGIVRHGNNRHRDVLSTHMTVTGTGPVPEPIKIHPAQIANGEGDYRLVQLEGLVRNAFRDEIDQNWNYIELNCDSQIVYVSFPDADISTERLNALLDAVISVKGICLPICTGRRIFFGPHIQASSISDIKIKTPPPADPFDAPLLDDMHHLKPDAVFSMRRHRVIGSVLAVWRGDRFLLETEDGRLMRIEMANGGRLPSYGDGLEIVGFPETDLYRINISQAICRPHKVEIKDHAPQPTTPADILKAPDGKTKIKPEYHGRIIRMRGFVRHLPSTGDDNGKMSIECDGYLVPVEVSGCPECLDGIEIGTELEITGVCILDTENWRPPALFPRLDGFLLVVRRPDDVRVLSLPSWWTPGRLLVIIGALLTALGGIFIWNRMLNQIVERRTRELTKERLAHVRADLKVEERTRLAVELHDTLSQNLTGISLQIDAAQMAAEENPNSVMPYLETARRKMQNCRENLRNCLWDLRSGAFEEKALAEAIRRTIAPHIGTTDVHVDMDVPCRKLSDNTLHAVLCIIRELVINAIRHGKASLIGISGQLESDGLSFSVSDNGVGFDPTTRPGLSEGHFGLQGVSERAHRLGGTFEITSKPNHGTTATFSHLSPDV